MIISCLKQQHFNWQVPPGYGGNYVRAIPGTFQIAGGYCLFRSMQDDATTYRIDLEMELFVAAGILNDLAIVRQAAWGQHFNRAAQFGDIADGLTDALL